jgi:hypothetical protein
MNDIPTERFGFTLKQPQPIEFGLSENDIRIFKEKTGLFRGFDSEYKSVKHKKEAFHRYEKAKENYTLACYRGRTEYWLALSPKHFEWEVARVFQALGWSAHVTGGSGDRGCDIRLHKNEKLAVVQCKAYKKTVGPNAVRELHSVVVTFGACRGYLASVRGFSSAAIHEAEGKPIVLIQAIDLAAAELCSISENLGPYNQYRSKLFIE